MGRLLGRLGLPSTVLSLLLAHAAAVRSDGDRLGLVAPGDLDQIVRRHTGDSLLFALARPPAPAERWIDVGSGAGFPGLVLAVGYPETSFTLLEPLKKRAGFLELQVSGLGLANVEVEARRLEELEEPRDYHVATARALAEPRQALRSMVRVVRPGGEIVLAIGGAAMTEGKQLPGNVRLATIEDPGNVDSPGRFFIMTREA